MNIKLKTHNKALQLTTKSGALLAFGATELNRYVYTAKNDEGILW